MERERKKNNWSEKEGKDRKGEKTEMRKKKWK